MADDPKGAASESTVDMEMARERPASDPLAMERARARIELAMFGRSKPARLGRYEILDPIAGGGMGLIYAAYDPELDRKVALKVLHPGRDHDERAHERLLKEARALARLDHPNVVKVHDVMSHDGQVVVVMPLLDGDTLATWESVSPHRLHEILAAYIQAGDGLAAAHSVDVVHRDFKPSNAVISPAGHVRVLDFGLARISGHSLEDATTGQWPLELPSRTIAGAFLGTPAFASPEQLAAAPVTAASDQFSYCVALHRAIEGVSPFRGETVDELVHSIRHDDVRTADDNRRVPHWLRATIRRGLAEHPMQRHSSMEALLAELRRTRGWRRWRWPVSTLGLVTAAIVAMSFVRSSSDSEIDCDGGLLRLGRLWQPDRARRLGATFDAIDDPYARDAKTRVFQVVDDRVENWSGVHGDACSAHGPGAESLLARKMWCLEQQLGDFDAAVRVLLRTDKSNVTHAVEVAAGIPPAQWCADSARVTEDAEPPRTPLQSEVVQAVRLQVGEAAALSRASRTSEAMRMSRASLAAAEGTRYEPLIAEAALELGRILIGESKYSEAIPTLQKALEASLATGRQPRLVIEAGARLLFAEGALTPDPNWTRRELRYLEPMSRSLTDHFARPLLLNNAGAVFLIAKQPEEAKRYLMLAHEALDDTPDIELTAIDLNLPFVISDPAERIRVVTRAWQRRRDLLGETHLMTLEAQTQLGILMTDASRAYDVMAPACRTYRGVYPSLLDLDTDCDIILGAIATEVRKTHDAELAYQRIIDSLGAASDTSNVVWRSLALAEKSLLRGDQSTALSEFHHVLELRADSKDWWHQQQAFQAELGLGILAAGAGNPVDARRFLEAAASGYEKILEINPGIQFRLRRDNAKRLLAALP